MDENLSQVHRDHRFHAPQPSGGHHGREAQEGDPADDEEELPGILRENWY